MRWIIVSVGLASLVACGIRPLPGDAIDVSAPGENHNAPFDPAFDPELGDDGAVSDAVQPTRAPCLHNGLERAVRGPLLGDLLITEVFANPSGADLFGDWLEIRVVADRPVDLNALEVVHTRLFNGDSRSFVLANETCLVALPGQYVVIGGSDVAALNQNAPVDIVSTPPLQLFNDAGRIEWRLGDHTLDVATPPEPRVGVSVGVDPGVHGVMANDSPDAWCDGTSGGWFDEIGTPGVANDPC